LALFGSEHGVDELISGLALGGDCTPPGLNAEALGFGLKDVALTFSLNDEEVADVGDDGAPSSAFFGVALVDTAADANSMSNVTVSHELANWRRFHRELGHNKKLRTLGRKSTDAIVGGYCDFRPYRAPCVWLDSAP